MRLSEAKKAGPEKTKENSRDGKRTGAEEGCPREQETAAIIQ